MPTITPVSGDPFKAPNITPVNYDPFAETSAAGSAGRAAARGALPAVGGAAGFGAGFALGGTATAPAEVIPVAGPIINLIGAFGGGLLGSFGGSSAVSAAQEKALSLLPDTWVKAIGQDPAQRAADTGQHPYATFAGDLAPNLLMMRPGFAAAPVAADASRLTKILASPVTGAAVGATVSGAGEGARQYQAGEFDPTKLGMATAFGAVANRPTKLGDVLFQAGGNAAIKAAQVGARAAGSTYRGATGAARDFRDQRNGSLVEGEFTRAEPPAAPRIKITPVEGDPFNPPRITPVEGNPFKAVPPALPAPPEASSHSSPPVVEPQPVEGEPAAAATPAPDGLRPDLSNMPDQSLGLITSLLYDAPAHPETGDQRVTVTAEEIADLRRHGISIDDNGNIAGAEVERLQAERARRIKAKPTPSTATADNLRPDPGPLADGEHYVTTPVGNRIRSKFEVVPAASLKAAEGDLQNRDRSRDSTDLQVQDIVNNFDATRLGASAETDRGAPIVGPDGVVESGNGRMLALNRIYGDPANAERAQAYRDYIESQGHSAEGVDNPVLIRRRLNDLTPEQRRQFVIDSNKDAKLAMTSVERARSDADALDGNSLALYRGGDIGNAGNGDFVKSFIGRMSPNERAGMVDANNTLSQDGIVRMENALMARAYENPDVLSKLMEARDNNIRSIGGGMLDNAAPWARLRADVKEGRVKPEFDITPKLVEAARRVSDLRARGGKVADLLNQRDAFSDMDPIVERFVRLFHNPELTRAASREAISDAIAKYVRRASEQTTEARMFGGGEMTPEQIVDSVLDERGGKGGDMFAVAAEDRAPPPANDDLDAWHAGVRAKRANRRGQTEEALYDTEGTISRDEGRDARSPGQGESEGGGREVSRAGEEGLDDKPDYSAGQGALALDPSPYDPAFATRSFTDRTSVYDSAAEALGIDPDKFRLMPAPRQVTLLKDAMRAKFGVEVIVDRGMQERFAIDQMLDAYQTVQSMAYVLDLPATAISLKGSLKIKMQKGGKFLGAFQPGANLIMLPRRSNSFAHEWAHALDFHLMDRISDLAGKGLTGALRKHGSKIIGQPASVREAFVDLLNAMFFEEAGRAMHIGVLEASIATSKSEKQIAAMTAELARLKDSNSQGRGIRSAFYKGAKSFDGPGGEYWTSPTEMFARAFEAYVSYKVEAAGLTTEFIGKGDDAYLSNAEERFAKTFPKDAERAAIFAAFEQLFGNLADEQVLGAGRGQRPADTTPRRMTDYDKTPKVQRERNIIKRQIAEIRNEAIRKQKELADRGADPKGKMETIADLNGVVTMSMTGNLRMIQARSGSRSLQKMIDLLTKQDGRGDRTVARTFAEDVHLQSKAAINRLTNIMKTNHIENLDVEDTKILRDLLIGAREDAPPGMGHLVRAAGAIRHLLDHEFYVNQQAGIDLGYTRSGYLARVLDLPKVYGDQPGFVEKATKVYEIVFDKEFKSAEAVLEGDETIPAFMKMARGLAKGGADLPALAGVRSLLKQINKLTAAAAKAEDPGPLLQRATDLQDDLADGMGELFDQARAAYAEERANAWLAKINLTAGEEHNAASPDSKYTKQRSLPPETDKIMEKYFLSDPIESVTNYLNTSARRTAYARRFGPKGEKRRALFEAMAAEGVSPADQISVARMLDIATGRMRSQLPAALQSSLSYANAVGTMALLPRATLSSLAEPFTAGLITGDLRDGFKMLGMQIAGALGSPNGKVRYELARAMGIVSDLAADGVMEARYGQTYADETRADRMVSRMFKATGLTALTRSQKTAGVGLGHAFIDNLANRLLGTNKWTSASDAKNAEALLRELGIRDPEAFAKQIVQLGRMPTVEELDSEFGHDYATAQLRFSTMVVQEPGMMDRPEMASNPAGRVIYGITGFSYGYWRNIIKRNGVLLSEMAKDKARGGGARSGFYGMALIGAAAVAYLMNLTISTIRERLLNPSRWNDLDKEGTLESTMAALAFTRTFSFGIADTVIQSYSGLKYQRDFSNIFVGPSAGFMLQNGQKILAPTVGNSRKTNTAEYGAAQGTYSAASPFIAFGLTRIPGGPITDPLVGLGMGYATSPAARDTFASFIAGPKDGSMVDGKKVKSGPTGLDRTLDGVFGPIARKGSSSMQEGGGP